jgi:hypothetical protein
MIEVLAAVAGASISVAAMGAFGIGKRNDEARDAVIRFTSAVEHIASAAGGHARRHQGRSPGDLQAPWRRLSSECLS